MPEQPHEEGHPTPREALEHIRDFARAALTHPNDTVMRERELAVVVTYAELGLLNRQS